MSLFDDIAHALGHTVETLALDVGTDVYELESVVNDLAGNAIDVFSIGDRFGLSTAGFLRSIVNILRGDPHEQLLGYITGPFKPVYAQVEGLAAQWGQMAQFHQETAQMLNLHISEVLHGDGTFSYSGPAAETLWNTHLEYLSSLNTMGEHAQTQQRRYAALGGHFGDFLSEAPRKVYSLSAPMAALGVLSFEASSPVLDQPIEQGTEQAIQVLLGDEEATPPSPISVLILIIIGIVALFLVILIIFFWIKSVVDDHNNQQKNTTVPSVKHKAVPTVTPSSQNPYNSLTPAQEDMANRLHADYGHLGLTLDDIRDIIEKNPNLTEAQLRELLDQYANVISANPNLVKQHGALAVFEEFITLAAYDAGHGGNYTLKQPVANMPNLQPGIEEATAEMGAMEEGKVPWPLTPSPIPRYDAKDPHGTEWDEKSYRSINTNGNAYNANDTVDSLQKDFGKGEKIIFDDSRLTQKEIDDTYDELKRRNQENDVVWWPTEPTQLKPPPTPAPTP